MSAERGRLPTYESHITTMKAQPKLRSASSTEKTCQCRGMLRMFKKGICMSRMATLQHNFFDLNKFLKYMYEDNTISSKEPLEKHLHAT